MAQNPYNKNQTSNSKNKYENAAARYKAENQIIVGAKNIKEKQPESQSVNLSNSNKNSTDNRDAKFKQSPYTQVMSNSGQPGASGHTTGLSQVSAGQGNKRQLA